MKRALRLLVFVSASLAVACGGNAADVKTFNQRRDLCNSLNGTSPTVAQVATAFQSTGLQGPTEFSPGGTACAVFVYPDKSTCQKDQTTCKIFWQTFGQDSSLCNLDACAYACIAYVSAQSPSDATVDSAIVCGTQFVSEQPGLF